MIDRINELRKRNPAVVPLLNDTHGQILAKNGSELYEENGQGISNEFFQVVRNAKSMITRIQMNTDTIQEMRGKYARAIKASQEKQVSQTIQKTLTDNKQIHNSIKNLLTDMKQIVESAENDQQLKNQPQTRMKRNFYASLSNQLAKVLEKERVQEDGYKNGVKDRIGRQVRLIDNNLTEDEVEHYINNPIEAEQMLQEKIYGQASVNLKNAVSDIQDKFRDIQKIQRSVAECLILFKQLAILVKEQGQMIDNIELNVNQSKDYVEKAEKHLTKAKEHHQCAKKYMWCLIIAGIILLIIILVPIIVTTSK